MGDLLAEFGLDEILPLDTLKAFADDLVVQLEDPNGQFNVLLKDVLGVDIAAIINDAVDQVPETEYDLETYLKKRWDIINLEIQGYLPVRDPFGPYFFFPEHCYPNSETTDKSGIQEVTQYNSPVIAYVRTGASVEQDIVAQM